MSRSASRTSSALAWWHRAVTGEDTGPNQGSTKKRAFSLALALGLSISGVGIVAAGAASGPRQALQCPTGQTVTFTPASPSASPSTSPCPTVTQTATGSPTGGPTGGATTTGTATPGPTSTSTVTVTPGPTQTGTASPGPTQTGGTQTPRPTTTATATATVTPTPGSPQCSDGIDNDGDGKTDFPVDEGCVSAQDPSELNTIPAEGTPRCSDALDNDGDGKIDHPADPGCDSPQDEFENDNRGNGGNGGGGRRFSSSRVSIKHDDVPHRFFGRVRSGRDRCESGRRVIVFEVQPGADNRVGTDRTNRRGRWSDAHVEGGAGRYYAKVARKSFRAGGRRIVCGADRSGRIGVSF